ncbi:MAG: NRDE family protein [Planctomycetes bacterium]|nr:NRDE family protein [Planctomycetota bacterium]
MCTVTIVPIGPRGANRAEPVGRGFRLACNRDESRARPAALPPVTRLFGARRAVLPIDPVSGGTWVAANDAGLVLTLLNVYPTTPGTRTLPVGERSLRSRGTIIPPLLELGDADSAAREAQALLPEEFPPFRLLLVDGRHVHEGRSDGRGMAWSVTPMGEQALLFTSSGLGDEVVEAPRRRLFNEMFRAEADWVAQQDEFHRHSWPDHPELSVCMRRAEACTVGHTVVEVTDLLVALSHRPGAPDQPGGPQTLTLDRRRGSACSS